MQASHRGKVNNDKIAAHTLAVSLRLHRQKPLRHVGLCFQVCQWCVFGCGRADTAKRARRWRGLG
jgi:hypothetical protein